MTDSILVAYATSYGSTQEVAGAVGAALREAGLEVDVQPARKVRDLSGYGAVVLGAPLYMFRLHRDARSFLSRHGKALRQLPFAVFALGPFNDEEKEWQGAREQLDKELAKFPDLSPAARVVFGGRFDPAQLRPPWSLLPALKGLPPSDIRDWAAVRSWAGELPAALRARGE
ncbi:MAG: flavodoxin domain-containing protein [Phycisphaerae bacterium]|nr:flavodoxin domain-containing protein [Phycisphaerae bacterium]